VRSLISWHPPRGFGVNKMRPSAAKLAAHRTTYFISHGLASRDGRTGFDHAVHFNAVRFVERKDVEVGSEAGIGEHFECVLQLVPDGRRQGEIMVLCVDDDVQQPVWAGDGHPVQQAGTHAPARADSEVDESIGGIDGGD
jgi:hypothetical protein